MDASHDFDAPALFRRLGLLPLQCGFYGGPYPRSRACLMSARMLVKGPAGKAKLLSIIREADPNTKGHGYRVAEALALELGYTTEYACGLAIGWDGKSSRSIHSHPDYLRGLKDGKAAWESCRHLLDDGLACGRLARQRAGELVGAGSSSEDAYGG